MDDIRRQMVLAMLDGCNTFYLRLFPELFDDVIYREEKRLSNERPLMLVGMEYGKEPIEATYVDNGIWEDITDNNNIFVEIPSVLVKKILFDHKEE